MKGGEEKGKGGEEKGKGGEEKGKGGLRHPWPIRSIQWMGEE